jgi:hypothetical protein
MNLKIKRLHLDDCTIGSISYGIDFRAFTLELPWQDNIKSHSCIPAGFYQCKKIVSPSLGECIEVSSVVGRTYIRIHKGNYTYQIQGCILVGDAIKDINGDLTPDVTNSGATFDKLMKIVPDSFVLEVS